MSYNNPSINVVPTPTGLDRVIESFRNALTVLPWLEKSFGRAFEFKEKDEAGSITRIPKVFLGSLSTTEGEYLDVRPNDFLKAQSFIKTSGPEEWEQFNRFEGSMKTRKLSIIFWVNLKEIDPAKDYIFIDELKGQVESILRIDPNTSSMDAYYDERVEDIFEGYTIDDTKTEYLMYPYAGMRFDITAIYAEEC